MFVSRFQKILVILYQSGETQIWYLINVLGAFHHTVDCNYVHSGHNTWMVPKRFGSKFSFLCGQDKVGWKVANQKPILFIQKRQGFKRLYWWRASQISHVFNTITNFDKINFPINEIHWIVLNFHHHGADCWEHRKCKDFFSQITLCSSKKSISLNGHFS